MTKRRNNPYDVNYVMIRDKCSREEAERTVAALKARTSGSKETYIKRYGEEEGIRKYNEFCRKSANTKDKFVEKYGKEEGEKKWNEYLKTKDGSSLDFFIKKYGKEEGKKKFDEKRKKSIITKDTLIKKYGKEEGEKRWNKICEIKRYKSSKEYLIEKFGENSKAMNGRRLGGGYRGIKFWLKKYDYDYEKAYKKFKDMILSRSIVKTDTISLDTFIKEKGDLKVAIDAYIKEMDERKLRVDGCAASKESILFFKFLNEKLEENGIKFNKIHHGFGGKKEYKIKIPNTKKYFFYDYTIEDINLIIEYNGVSFHPNPEWLVEDMERWESWVEPWSGASAEEKYEYDLYKKSVAEEHGFRVIYVWSDSDRDKSIDFCLEEIQKLRIGIEENNQ